MDNRVLKITKLPKALENEAPPRLSAFIVALTAVANNLKIARGPASMWGCEFIVI